MAVNTILMDFSVKSSKLQSDQQEELLTKVLGNYFPQLCKVYSRRLEDGGGYMLLYTALRGSTISVRAFPQGLLTLSIDYYKAETDEELITFQERGMLESQLCYVLCSTRSKLLPTLKRGANIDVYLNSSGKQLYHRLHVLVHQLSGPECFLFYHFLGSHTQCLTTLEKDLSDGFGRVISSKFPPLRRGGLPRYYPTSDERILEYDIDAVVFEEMSPYQKVQIVHSKTLGNMLILDGLQNLSDRDLIYTETLMQRGRESYEGKEVVILGGGDGALLHELLKENPKMVLMFELDEVVIRACREHMRDCCGDALDAMKGANYEIVIGDCMESLKVMMEEGRKFDYVFGDLTDVPVTPTPQSEVWDFIRLIINTSLKILKPQGKYMTHCCGVACEGAAKMFEEQLESAEEKLEWTTSTAFIPSFLEDWLFYQVFRRTD